MGDSREDEAAVGAAQAADADGALTLAGKLNSLIDSAHPAGRGPYSNAEIAALIERTTGEQVSGTQIWKLRNGQAQNPQKRLIEALARTFGVPPGYFFDDYDPKAAGLVQEQVELLALVRDSGITAVQLRAIAGLPAEAREAVVRLIEATARAESGRRNDPGEPG